MTKIRRETVKTMSVETIEKNNSTKWISVDGSLLREPSQEQAAVPVDQLMAAVEGVRRYVCSHLNRIGRYDDVDDVLQDIRVAVWDGLVQGRYRELPGISFRAWVQGVSCNICAAYVRREMSHQTLALLPEYLQGDLDPVATMPAVLEADQFVDRDCARTVLALTRENVPKQSWDLAVGSLCHARAAGGQRCPEDRRRWQAVTIVRLTALTVRNALDALPVEVDGARPCAGECLPTLLLRRVAREIIITEARGTFRATAIAALAGELQISERYIAVQIGLARRLYAAALAILEQRRATAVL